MSVTNFSLRSDNIHNLDTEIVNNLTKDIVKSLGIYWCSEFQEGLGDGPVSRRNFYTFTLLSLAFRNGLDKTTYIVFCRWFELIDLKGLRGSADNGQTNFHSSIFHS